MKDDFRCYSIYCGNNPIGNFHTYHAFLAYANHHPGITFTVYFVNGGHVERVFNVTR